MLNMNEAALIELPPDQPPQLLVVIDTEEDFDWAHPLSRENTAVRSIQAQHRAQEIFDKHGLKPTYVVDYPVATAAAAVETLGTFLREGRCEIGAHLHPWVNPPHDEPVNPYNSYPGNLPAALERAKLERLTRTIEENFGQRPTVYRAGRYGVGPATGGILDELGYEIDLSVVPFTSFAEDGGPDFTGHGATPYWFGDRGKLLEIPLSCGFSGLLAGSGPAAYPWLSSPWGMRIRAPGIAARLGLIERIRLTPEGIDLAAHRRLTESLLAQACRVFSMSFHSPSLEPGNTPYVRDETGLNAFLNTLDRYLGYFMHDLGGQPTTATALRRSWLDTHPARPG